MTRTSALEFQRNFGEFEDRAQHEPIDITRPGRRGLVLMSADHDDWLTTAAKRTHLTANTSAVVIDAVENATMDPEQRSLDRIRE